MLKSIILSQKHLIYSVDVRMQVTPVSLSSKKKKSEKERIVWGDDKKKGNLLTSMFDNFRWSD